MNMSGNSTPILENVDDTDSRLVYQGLWSLSSNDSSYFSATSHTTWAAGSSVEFTFVGSNVAVYGTLIPAGGNSSYVLDDDVPIFHDGSPVIAAPLPRQVLYSSPVLSETKHVLTITSLSDVEFIFDYLQFTTTNPAANPFTSVSANSISSTSAASSMSATPASPTSLHASASSLGLAAGPVHGIVIAIIATLAGTLSVLLWRKGYCCCGRRTRAKKISSIDIEMTEGINSLRESPSISRFAGPSPNFSTATLDMFQRFKPELRSPMSHWRSAPAPPRSGTTNSDSIIFSSVVYMQPVSTVSAGSGRDREKSPRRYYITS